VNIKTIEVLAVRLPMIKPVIMAGQTVSQADNVLVRIEAGNGVIGWGEAASAPTMTGETTESMLAAVHYLTPALKGRPADDIAGALSAMHGRMYGNHGAKAAIEIALHDLVGRATGRPVHALLGEKWRGRVPIMGVLAGGDRDGDLRDATRKKSDGFTAYKIKVGIDPPDRDAERTREICKALGDDCLISADANQGYALEQAVAYVRAVAGAGLGFFEQPVRADNLAAMATVAAATEIAIGADEGIHSRDDIERHHERKAARGVSLKIIKLGGLRGVVEAGGLCERLGMAVNLACKTGESSIACAAALHAAAVIPNVAWGVTLTHGGLAEDVAAQPVRIDEGHADIPERPGLGIEVDEDRVRRYRIGSPSRYVA
jgi:muconate cycloisomerase